MVYDSHFHLPKLPQPAKLLEELHKIGYYGESSACFPEEWDFQISLLKGSPHFSQCIGIHPEIATTISEEDISRLQFLLERNPNISLGECGLDKRFKGYEPNGLQEIIFRKQICLARDYHRKIIIHCVGDYGRLIKILQEELPRKYPIYFHRYAGTPNITKATLEFEASFGNPSHLEFIPKDKILFETDADQHFCSLAQTPSEIASLLKQSLSRIIDKYSKNTIEN